MSADSGRAVFLSYASQDAAAAKRIADALRAAGIEVWFDQSELVGGDAWDAKIRGQISSCALFVPIISANTQARREGYFRIEWKLAAQRTHAMSDDTPFLLPVVIDDTNDAVAKVPVEFKAVQWTKLPDGETSAAFATRVAKLVSGEPLDTAQGRSFDAPGRPPVARVEARTADREAKGGNVARAGWKIYGGLGAAVVALTAAGWWFLARSRATPSPAPAVTTAAAPVSEARQKLAQAQAMMTKEDYLNRANLETVEEVLQRVLTLDSTEADAWALVARVDSYMFRQGYDSSEGRRQKAFDHAGKAISLAPDGWNSRLAKALVLRVAGNTPATLAEAEEIYRTLLRERPDDPTALREAAYMLKDAGKPLEAARLVERMGDLVSAGWYYTAAGEFAEARRLIDGELAKGRNASMLKLKIYVDTMGYEDLAAAQAASARFTGTELLDDEYLAEALRLEMFRRDSAEILRLLAAFPREAIAASTFQGSKREFTGMAHHLAGREEIARSEWRLALQQAREQSQAASSEPRWLYKVAMLHAWLGETAEAQAALERARGLQGLAADNDDNLESMAVDIVLGRREAAVANLERNQAKGRPAHAYARFLWLFDPLRGDPRFEQFLRDHLPPTAKPLEAHEASTPPDEKSLVVLPLENLSPDPENAFFTDGIHAEIIATLQRVTDLRVIGRDSALTLKRGSGSLAELGARAGVANVMTGSVRRAGTKVRVLLELRRARDEALLWASPQVDRELKDVFALQSEIADEVARVLQAREVSGTNANARFLTKQPRAYDLVLKGNQVYFSGRPRSFEEASVLFREAHGLDPEYVVPVFMLAAAYCNLVFTTEDPIRQAELAAEAKTWAERATSLDPSGTGANAMALYYMVVRDYPRALEQSERAMRALPNDTATPSFRAFSLLGLGRAREAAELFRRAAELDPLNHFCLGNYAMILGRLRRSEESRLVLDRALAMVDGMPEKVAALTGRAAEARFVLEGVLPDPGAAFPADGVIWSWRARRFAEVVAHTEASPPGESEPARFYRLALRHDALRRLERRPEAEQVLVELRQTVEQLVAHPEFGTTRKPGWQAALLGRTGQPAEAIAAARRYVEAASPDLLTEERWNRELDLARLHALLHQPTECVELLRKLLRVPSGLTVPMLRMEPDWDPIRDDAHFKALLADPANSAPF